MGSLGRLSGLSRVSLERFVDRFWYLSGATLQPWSIEHRSENITIYMIFTFHLIFLRNVDLDGGSNMNLQFGTLLQGIPLRPRR